MNGKSQMTLCETLDVESRIQKLDDENVIEFKLINAYFKNNKVVHRDYLRVTKEHVTTLQVLLEEARALKPLDAYIDHASKFAERIQDLTRVHNTQQYVAKQNVQKTNSTMLPSISRVSYTNASGSQYKSNTRNDRIHQPSSRSKKNKLEAHHRKLMSSSNENNHVLDCNTNVKNADLSSNFANVC
ncbi:hypothetical protein Tco_0811971 [Tanacetum coccineum]